MGKNKVSAQQMMQAGNYLASASGKINSALASVQGKINAIKSAASKLDSYNQQTVAGREDIAEWKSSYNYTNQFGDQEMVFRVTTYRVFDEIWNISGQSAIEASVSKIERELANYVNRITAQIGKYSGQIKGNAHDVAVKQKKIEALLNDKEFNKYFKDNIFYNKNQSGKANIDNGSIPYWTSEKLQFKPVGNNTYVIYKGGVAMGFTTGAAVEAYLNNKNGAKTTKTIKASGKLSDAEYEKLRQARMKEAEGRKKQQQAEADEIRAKKKVIEKAVKTMAAGIATGKQTASNSTKGIEERKDEVDNLKKGIAKMADSVSKDVKHTAQRAYAATKANQSPDSQMKVETFGERIVKDAETYVGKVPYSWGGKATADGKIPDSGLDCSGFVSHVIKQSTGKDVGVGTVGLKQNCTPISKDQLQPGDLAFRFAGGDDRHVGIYKGKDANGNLVFVHENDTAHNVSVDNYDGWTEFGRLK